MWVVHEKKLGMTVRLIGPFPTAQDAAMWVSGQYTPRLGTHAVIEQLLEPEKAAKPG
jgi:hypothetical protein